MTREPLRDASDRLREAAEDIDDADLRERVHTQSQQLADLATAEHGPDHGRLARHMNALDEIADAAGGEAADAVRAARERVADYRETVEGV